MNFYSFRELLKKMSRGFYLSLIFVSTITILTSCSNKQLLSEGPQQTNIVPEFLHPLFEIFYEDMVAPLLKSSRFKALDIAPEGLKINELYSKQSMGGAIWSVLNKEITAEELEVVEAFFSADAGGIYLDFMKQVIAGDIKDPVSGVQELRAKYSKEFSEITEQQVEAVISFGSKMANAGNSEALNAYLFEHLSLRFDEYYKTHKFTSADTDLCLAAQQALDPLYAINVCDAGLNQGDYRSSMQVAKQYYSGVFGAYRTKNIEVAKDIYRSLLKDDIDGEAHYNLGMLTINFPNSQLNEIDKRNGYCLLKEAHLKGYSRANAALDEHMIYSKTDC